MIRVRVRTLRTRNGNEYICGRDSYASVCFARAELKEAEEVGRRGVLMCSPELQQSQKAHFRSVYGFMFQNTSMELGRLQAQIDYKMHVGEIENSTAAPLMNPHAESALSEAGEFLHHGRARKDGGREGGGGGGGGQCGANLHHG